MDLARIVEMAGELASGHGGAGGAKETVGDGDGGPGVEAVGAVGAVGTVGADTTVAPGAEGPPLLGAIRHHEEAFRAARGVSDVAAMVEAVLALDDELWAWSADTLQSDALDRGAPACGPWWASWASWPRWGARPRRGGGALRRARPRPS